MQSRIRRRPHMATALAVAAALLPVLMSMPMLTVGEQEIEIDPTNPMCYVQGLVKSGAWGLVATLPEECRPNKRLVFNVNHHEATARVDVLTNGQVVWQAGGTTFGWISLTGIMFAPSSVDQQPLTLENGWKDYGRGYGPPTVALGGDTCSVQGLVESAGWGNASTSGCQSQTKGALVTSKGEGKVGTCTFPFTYSGTTYDSCASPDDYGGIGWCAWDTTFASGRWGYCTPGCPGTDIIATLPEECRPNKELIFNLNQHETTHRVNVHPDGKIEWEAGAKTKDWLSLTGIVFVPGAENQQPLLLENGWQAYGREWSSPTVAVLGNTCSVQGLVKDGGWDLVATLPSECRPNKQLIFNLNQHSSTARVDVLTNGEVVWVAGSKTIAWLSLTGITFAPGADNQQPVTLENGWKAYGKNWGSPTLVPPLVQESPENTGPGPGTTTKEPENALVQESSENTGTTTEEPLPTANLTNLTANATDDGQQSTGIPKWGYALIGIGAWICCLSCSVLLFNEDSDDGTSTEHGPVDRPAIVQPVVREVSEEQFDGFGSDGGELGGESSADAPAVPIDVVSESPSDAAAEARALANLKWEQKMKQLTLGSVLLAATLATFIEAGTNKGLQHVEPSSDVNLANVTNATVTAAMSCTDPRPDPLTNSTAHFGDCCGVYGVTPKPLWVLLLQALLTALIFDLGGHMWSGKADLFRFEAMSHLSKAYLLLQGVLAMVSTYSILAKYNYGDNGWDTFTRLLLVWLNSSAGTAMATAAVLLYRVIGADQAEARKVLIKEIGAVKYAALDEDEQTKRVDEVDKRLSEEAEVDSGHDCVYVWVMLINSFFTLFFFPLLITHLIPALVIYFPMALSSFSMIFVSGQWLYEEPIFPADPEKPHTVMERLICVPARALVSSWGFCSAMIFFVLIPTWMAIFYSNTSWHGALVQDWESRDTGRFFECLNIQFESVTGGVDAIGLIF